MKQACPQLSLGLVFGNLLTKLIKGQQAKTDSGPIHSIRDYSGGTDYWRKFVSVEKQPRN